MFSLSTLNEEIKKKRKAYQAASQSKPPEGSKSTEHQTSRPTKKWKRLTDIEAFQFDQRVANSSKQKTPCDRPPNSHHSLPNSATTISDGQPSSSNPSKPVIDEPIHTSKLSSERNHKHLNDPPNDPPLSKTDVIRRLRALKHPATLFGEDAWDRFNRLRDLQLSREEQTDGQRNFFQKKLREVQAKDAEEDVFDYTGSKLPTQVPRESENATKSSDRKGENDAVNHKEEYVSSQIRKYMRLWKSEIDSMSKEERRTNKGRFLLVTYEQTKHWLEPLERLLRKRNLSKTILVALRDIFEAAAEREYTQATRMYLERLAIGNAPWPMGATQVGIHSRAAREKIGEDKIAHVMNDEQTRKYVQAVKRLLTVAQRHFPTDISKMIVS